MPRARPYRSVVLMGLALVMLALAIPAGAGATASTYVVDLNEDTTDGACTSGDCTLREAIELAESDGDDPSEQDHVVISLSFLGSGTISLGSTLPTITEPLSIERTGIPTIVDGGDAVRPFVISTPAGADVSIDNLTVRNGATTNSGSGSGGAGIRKFAADLTISDSTISGNQTHGTTAEGAGVYSPTGTLTIDNSLITGNSTAGSGSSGAGVYASSATIRRSTISQNETNGTNARGGGAVLFGSSPATIESTTISGNHTEGDTSDAGGLYLSETPATIRNSTISGNHTSGIGSDGGGVFSNNADPDPVLVNTIVADNAAAGTGPDFESFDDIDVFRLAYTLVENTGGAPFLETVVGSSIFGSDPQLGPLAPNGGRNPTQLPGATSPVLDRGATDEATDQRGLARPVDIAHLANPVLAAADGADLGAVELSLAEGPPVPAAPAQAGQPTGLRAAALKKCKKKKKGRARARCRKKAQKLPR